MNVSVPEFQETHSIVSLFLASFDNLSEILVRRIAWEARQTLIFFDEKLKNQENLLLQDKEFDKSQIMDARKTLLQFYNQVLSQYFSSQDEFWEKVQTYTELQQRNMTVVSPDNSDKKPAKHQTIDTKVNCIDDLLQTIGMESLRREGSVVSHAS